MHPYILTKHHLPITAGYEQGFNSTVGYYAAFCLEGSDFDSQLWPQIH